MKIIEEPTVEYQVVEKIVSARYLSGYQIEIIFNDDAKSVVDFEEFISNSQHPSIRKFVNLHEFKRFKIVNGNLNWNDYELIFPLSDLKKGSIL